MPNSFVMICEHGADFRTAARLVERRLCASIAWLDEGVLQGCPLWRSVEEGGDPFLLWSRVRDVAAQLPTRLRLSARGRFRTAEGQTASGAADAAAARQAILVVKLLVSGTASGLDAVVLVRDADHQPQQRRRGLEQAREHEATIDARGAAIVVGLADRERESWILTGFLPESPDEVLRLEEERRSLGFDPTEQPERLRDAEGSLRCPKRVLKALTQGDDARARRCIEVTPIDALHRRGRANGLAQFLDEIDARLAPVVHGSRSNPSSAGVEPRKTPP